MDKQQVSNTDQDILNLVIPTFDVVQHHVLCNVFPILQLVHLVVSVRVQNGPAQELGQSLGNRDRDQDEYFINSEGLYDVELFSAHKFKKKHIEMLYVMEFSVRRVCLLP